MSFSSKSSKRNHYKDGHQGSSHYQKKGLFGSLFDVVGSRSRSHGHYENQNNNTPSFNKNTTNLNSANCSKCGSQIPAGSKFCLECGEKVSEATNCMNCGEKLPPNAKFCLSCGNKVNK